MSDIKVGDLVVVARPWSCCPQNTHGMGAVRTVMGMAQLGVPCFYCGNGKGLLAAELGDGLCPVDRLKRIPPLEELERDEIVKELTA